MKAGIVQAVHAVASLADRSGVEILITADEEVGSGTAASSSRSARVACGNVLVCEPSADGGALKIARKGTGTFEVVVHGKAAHAGLEPEKGINSLVGRRRADHHSRHLRRPVEGHHGHAHGRRRPARPTTWCPPRPG